ncbi:hypothetical protein AOA57_31155, partial [Pseudomonas sp. 2588-5]
HERYDYPGRYTERKQGETYARTLIESQKTGASRISGATRARGLFPGALMTLVEHRRSEQNAQCLLLEARYTLSLDTY